jgi:DNA-binding transcriptional MocR family regulator
MRRMPRTAIRPTTTGSGCSWQCSHPGTLPGAPTFTVYCAIKSQVAYSTGHSFPPVKTLAKDTGLSDRQVIRSLKTLEELQYLTKTRQGRNNVYTLREKVTVKEGNDPVAIATWDYIPAAAKQAHAELKNYLVTGDDRTAVIHIEKLVINHLHIGNVEGNQNNYNLNADNLDPVMKKKLGAIQEKAKRRK